jgi:hypothetical protein
MSTDDDLTTLLRRGFTHATTDLDPDPDLARAVRRQYDRARRRHRAVAVAVPAAALAVGTGLALAGRAVPSHNAKHTPSRTALAVPKTAPVTSAPTKPAGYMVMAVNRHSAPPNCPANATAPVGKSEKPAGAWFFTKEGTCVFVHISWAHTKPANAAPVHIKGYPGLYGTLGNGVRTIYAPVAPGTDNAHPGGGWVKLTLAANAPTGTAVRLILVPGS